MNCSIMKVVYHHDITPVLYNMKVTYQAMQKVLERYMPYNQVYITVLITSEILSPASTPSVSLQNFPLKLT